MVWPVSLVSVVIWRIFFVQQQQQQQLQQQQAQQQQQQQQNQLFFGGHRHQMDKSLELEQQMKNPADAMFAAMDSGFR